MGPRTATAQSEGLGYECLRVMHIELLKPETFELSARRDWKNIDVANRQNAALSRQWPGGRWSVASESFQSLGSLSVFVVGFDRFDKSLVVLGQFSNVRASFISGPRLTVADSREFLAALSTRVEPDEGDYTEQEY
jgi:hypothetical protein